MLQTEYIKLIWHSIGIIREVNAYEEVTGGRFYCVNKLRNTAEPSPCLRQ